MRGNSPHNTGQSLLWRAGTERIVDYTITTHVATWLPVSTMRRFKYEKKLSDAIEIREPAPDTCNRGRKKQPAHSQNRRQPNISPYGAAHMAGYFPAQLARRWLLGARGGPFKDARHKRRTRGVPLKRGMRRIDG